MREDQGDKRTVEEKVTDYFKQFIGNIQYDRKIIDLNIISPIAKGGDNVVSTIDVSQVGKDKDANKPDKNVAKIFAVELFQLLQAKDIDVKIDAKDHKKLIVTFPNTQQTVDKLGKIRMESFKNKNPIWKTILEESNEKYIRPPIKDNGNHR
jgi:hypothetical protein